MKKLGSVVTVIIIATLTTLIFILIDTFVFNQKHIATTNPDVVLNAESLISQLKNGIETKPILQAENIVEISGIIKEINLLNDRITIILDGGQNESATVICDMNKDLFKKTKIYSSSDSIKLKGIYKGYLKDAVLLNCIIIP